MPVVIGAEFDFFWLPIFSCTISSSVLICTPRYIQLSFMLQITEVLLLINIERSGVRGEREGEKITILKIELFDSNHMKR